MHEGRSSSRFEETEHSRRQWAIRESFALLSGRQSTRWVSRFVATTLVLMQPNPALHDCRAGLVD
jgi:hypothetical protein